MVLPKKGLHISKVWSKEGGPMDNWSACMIRGQARDLVVITLYLKDGEGMSPTNLARLGQVHGLLKSIKVPWIILGDFNMGPAILDQGGFLDLIGGSVITAENGASTCTTGKGSLLDYAVARKDIADSIQVSQDLEAPWSPHVGLKVSIQVGAWKDKIWKLAHPKHLPGGRSFGPHNEAPPRVSQPSSPPFTHYVTHPKVWGQEGNFWAPGSQSQTQEPQEEDKEDGWDSLPKSEQANSPDLTQRYQEWSSKAEEYLLSTWALTANEFQSSLGSGAPPVWKLSETVPPNKMRDTLDSDSASLWGALQGRLRQLSQHLIKDHRPGPQEAKLIRCIQVLTSKAQLSLNGLSEGTQTNAIKVLEDLRDPRWTKATLLARVLAERAGKIADEAAHQLRQSKHESFRKWVMEGLEEPGAGRVHRFISDKTQPVGHTEQGEPEDEDLLWGHEAMEARLTFWNQYWKGHEQEPDWPVWLEGLRQEALSQVRESERDPISTDQVLKCIQKAPANAGLGLDSWRPRDWEHLPPAML
jgi:hypothetical protein